MDTMIDFKEWFYYDETSPSGLRWVKDCMGGMYMHILKKRKGDVAGIKYTRRQGKPFRWVVTLKNKKYSAHRIIWQIINGEIPVGMIIDHLDRNPFNNKIINLALKTKRQNQQNLSKNCRNKTGITGVSLSTCGEYFVASYQDSIINKYVRKRFSIKRYGYDTAFDMACTYRKDSIQKMRDAGDLYTETHGE